MSYKTIIGVLGILAFSSCMNNNNLLVIGHRGAMGHETENTLASMQKALDLGVDMIELDVFQIDSGEIVVFHDERVERISNGGGRIEEYNIVDLKALTLDGNHKIPMLQEVLDLVKHQIPLNIELKGANTAEKVNFIINHYIATYGWSLEDFVISSFDWNELEQMRKFNPEIAIAVLTEEDPLAAIPMAKKLNAIAINPDHSKLTLTNAAEIKEAGFKIFPWTVNELEHIERMKKIGVDGIFTNYPERIN